MKSDKSEKQSKNVVTPILVFLLIIAAFAIGVLWQQNKNLTSSTTVKAPGQDTVQTGQDLQREPQAPQVSLDTIKALFSKDLIKFGDANRKVLFVAVEDPSCPYCAIASGHNASLNKSAGSDFTLVSDGGTYIAPVMEMKKLLDKGDASFIYIYSPGHGNGELGTKAMYCAYENDKFWQVHDLIMSEKGYTLLNETVKNDIAKVQILADFLKPAIDPKTLVACLQSGKYDARLSSDTKVADSLGIRGTPGFYVNTTNFPGAISFEAMQPAVNEALGK